MKTAEKIREIADKHGWNPLEEFERNIAERRAGREAGQAACARDEGQAAADRQVVPITLQPSQPVGEVLGDELKKRDQQVASSGARTMRCANNWRHSSTKWPCCAAS